MSVGEDWTAAEILRADGRAPLVLVCEHASNAIPATLGSLGMTAQARKSHAAWDPGARDVARVLSDRLDAPLVAGRISRLVYDCNRPLAAADAIPTRSEQFDIPGNAGLGPDKRRWRHAQVAAPFHAAVAGTMDAQARRAAGPVALVTIHSFTPVFLGQFRATELGWIHHRDPALARAAHEVETRRGVYRSALNRPYSRADGVTHTLALHGEARGLRALMIEIRNDLIATPCGAAAMAAHLHGTLREALRATTPPREAAR